MTTNYVPITAGSGTDIGAESLTMDSNSVWVQYVKNVMGPEDTYTAVQSARLVDGSSSAGAAFVDPRPNSAEVSKTPTITASSYTAGYSLGGVIDFGAIARVSGGGLLITGATLVDTSQQNLGIDLFLFNANPSNGTYTDHAAPTANATDSKMIRGLIQFGAYENIGSIGHAHVDTNIQVVPNSTQHLYGLMIVRSAPTYASTTAVTVTLGYIAD